MVSKKLFSLHGELGYFNLFEGQMQLPLLILGPRGFGKSELFLLFIEQFDDSYVKFIPVASDGVVFQQDTRGINLEFRTKGEHVSIRGRDNLDWERKIPIETEFDKDYSISPREFQFGIMVVGALGLVGYSRHEYKDLIRNRGHRLNFKQGVNLIRIKEPSQYKFDLIRDLLEKPADWKQLEVYKSGKLGKIDSEFRLLNKIAEFLPSRILELTLPEEENKWGQLRDVFKALVLKLDRLIISTVEFNLSQMVRRETKQLIDQVHYEWKFPENRQLPNLSGIPEILLINRWLLEKIKKHGPELELPNKTRESIETGLLSIQTAFVESLGTALNAKERISSAQELRKMATIHSIAIGDLITGLAQRTLDTSEIVTDAKRTKKEIDALQEFLADVLHGEI
jgi:hypothetical protein